MGREFMDVTEEEATDAMDAMEGMEGMEKINEIQVIEEMKEISDIGDGGGSFTPITSPTHDAISSTFHNIMSKTSRSQ